jgi:hypothetical protein
LAEAVQTVQTGMGCRAAGCDGDARLAANVKENERIPLAERKKQWKKIRASLMEFYAESEYVAVAIQPVKVRVSFALTYSSWRRLNRAGVEQVITDTETVSETVETKADLEAVKSLWEANPTLDVGVLADDPVRQAIEMWRENQFHANSEQTGFEVRNLSLVAVDGAGLLDIPMRGVRWSWEIFQIYRISLNPPVRY